MLFGLLVEAFAFGAHDNGGGQGPIHLIVIDRAAFVDSINPVAACFEIFEGAVDVGDARDGQVFQGTGGGFCDRFCEADRSPFGDDDSVGSGGMRGTDDGAQIVWIFDAIENYDEAGIGGYFVEFGILRGGAESDDALVRIAAGETAEGSAFFEAYGDIGGAGEVDDFLDTRTASATGDHDAVESAAGF